MIRLNDGDGGFYLDKAADVSKDPEDPANSGKQNEYELAGALCDEPAPIAKPPLHGLPVPWVRRSSSKA